VSLDEARPHRGDRRDRRDRIVLAGAGGVWGALAAAIAWRLNGLAVDDFFITYRYAQNLAGGHGFVFNPGERVFGLTEPGLGLLLAALHAVTRLDIPALGTASTALALAGIALLMLAEGIEHGRRAEALVGGTLVVTSSYLWVNQGAAVPVVLLLLLAAARLGERRLAVAGLLAGAAVWMRPDALAGAGLLGILLWSGRRRLPWRYGVTAAAVVVAGAALARAYFDVWLPNTLAAKHAMLEAGAGGGGGWSGLLGFWPRAVPLLARHWGAGWWAVIAVGLVGQWPFFRTMGRGARLLVLFAAFLDIAYPCLQMPFFSWYAVPFAVATLYGAAFAVLGLARVVGRWPAAAGAESSPVEGSAEGTVEGTAESLPEAALAGNGPSNGGRGGRETRMPGRAAAASAVVAAVLLAVLFVPLVLADWRWFEVFNWQPQLDTYRRAAAWLAQNSAPADDVAYVEIGVLAYYSQRPIVDLLGLVTPGSIPYVEHDDLVGAFLAHPTRYFIFHTRGRMRPILVQPWFPHAYEQVARFDQAGGKWLAIFRRVPGSTVPPARPPAGVMLPPP
jgi:hypothetical protein